MSYQSYRQLYREEEMEAMPVIVNLRDTCPIKVKKFRNLPCGHRLEPGDWYGEHVYLCDGEFTVDYECSKCEEKYQLQYNEPQHIEEDIGY